jgi:hypothetical protein
MSILIVPPRSPNLGETMLKSCIQTSVLYNIVERVVITSQGIMVLLVGFDITIEHDAYIEYFWLVRSLSL